VSGHGQQLALAVLLYFDAHENTPARETLHRWRRLTGGQSFGATALIEMAHRILDDQPLPETPRPRARKEDRQHP
jgi:hypothetical protein